MSAPDHWPLPPALSGARVRLDGDTDAPLAAYASPRAQRPDADESNAPLLLLHGAGAGSSAAELKPCLLYTSPSPRD